MERVPCLKADASMQGGVQVAHGRIGNIQAQAAVAGQQLGHRQAVLTDAAVLWKGLHGHLLL